MAQVVEPASTPFGDWVQPLHTEDGVQHVVTAFEVLLFYLPVA